MLREHGIVMPVLLYEVQRPATAGEVLKSFKVQYSTRAPERDKEEAVYTNLEAFMSLLEGNVTLRTSV